MLKLRDPEAAIRVADTEAHAPATHYPKYQLAVAELRPRCGNCAVQTASIRPA